MPQRVPLYLDFENGHIKPFQTGDTIDSSKATNVGGQGGVSDGDKGDIVVSAEGATWTIENSAVTNEKLAGSISPSKITQDADNRFVTDAEKTTWNSKAAGTHNHSIADVTNLQTTLDGKRAAYTLVATLANDQATGANTTPVTLTGLTFNYEANSKYKIWFMGQISPAAATTGCGFQFDLSSAVTSISLQFFHQLANTGTLSGGHSIADDASVGVSSGLPGTSNYPVTGFGLLITGANTGSAQLRFRSETTAVITAKSGLTLVVEKIS